MAKTFTFRGDLADELDYARWRLNDTNPQVRSDEEGQAAPRIWDQTYAALFENHGVQYGMYLAARQIASQISTEMTSFGEAAGIRFSLDNADYYLKVAEEILNEPAFGSDSFSLAKVGTIKRGVTDSYASYRRYEGYPVPTE